VSFDGTCIANINSGLNEASDIFSCNIANYDMNITSNTEPCKLVTRQQSNPIRGKGTTSNGLHEEMSPFATDGISYSPGIDILTFTYWQCLF
jgi:hypothetical protein